MRLGHAFNVIAMLELLLKHETVLIFADLAAGAAGRLEHGHEVGQREGGRHQSIHFAPAEIPSRQRVLRT